MGFVELIVLVLFGIFTYMKLTEKGKIANWSWWRVTSPLWIYTIFAFVVYGVIIGSIASFMSAPAGF